MNPNHPRPASGTLPPPEPEALAQSDALAALIQDEIARSGGWIGFDRYMELALYTPRLGYYSGGAHKFGPGGDFITAPELTPLFGQALARQVVQIMQGSAPLLLEAGAGTGLLAADLLAALDELDCLPQEYLILELSGELRARQAETLAQRVPALVSRVRWLDDLPTQFAGCVVANEVLDVMPVRLPVWRAEGLFERGVGLAGGALAWAERPADAALRALTAPLPVPTPAQGEYQSEVCPAAAAWVAEWGRRLVQGALILIDYGYPRAEYYLPHRAQGTLQCYYRHRAHPDALLWPGLNDITSFVDFTAAAEAGYDAGLDVLGYTSQASFLTNCGLLELLARRGPTESADYLRAARAAQRLIAPHEMGELFKVLLLGRNLGDMPLLGLTRGERTHAL